MRIVGGKFRGRALASPKSQAIRPTSDRTRESLFNILAHHYGEYLDSARVIDLFAGTGALGLEAASRGAEFVLFVEQSSEGRGLLRENVERCAMQGISKVFRRDATNLGSIGNMKSFDLAFADPPYGNGLGEKAAMSLINGGWLAPEGLLVLEEARDAAPETLPGFTTLDKRHFSDTVIVIFKRHTKT